MKITEKNLGKRLIDVEYGGFIKYDDQCFVVCQPLENEGGLSRIASLEDGSLLMISQYSQVVEYDAEIIISEKRP